MKVFIATILTVFALSIWGVAIVKRVHLEQNCTGYLKRAADANTVETASNQMSLAIDYLEKNNLTSGYTSVLWKTPDEDIEFWFNNLNESYIELSKVDSATSTLEKTNMLMKLRETLIDEGENGDTLTVPDGLSRYPNNLMFGILGWLSVFLLLGVFWWVFFSDDFW